MILHFLNTILRSCIMSKTVAIVPAGGGDVQEITIEPGVTAGDVLQQAGLEGFWLSKPNSDHFLGESEGVYDLVNDGEKLVASTPAVVGSGNGTHHFCIR
jgi:hypothetical protein